MNKFKTKAITKSLNDMGVFDIFDFDIDNNTTHKNMLVLIRHKGMIFGFNKIMPFFKNSSTPFDSEEVASMLRNFINFYIQRIDRVIFYKDLNSSKLQGEELAFELSELILNQSNFFNLIYKKNVRPTDLYSSVLTQCQNDLLEPIDIFNNIIFAIWHDKSNIDNEIIENFKNLYEQW